MKLELDIIVFEIFTMDQLFGEVLKDTHAQFLKIGVLKRIGAYLSEFRKKSFSIVKASNTNRVNSKI